MARILWVPAFELGSYLPVIPIVRELCERGHDVTALCTPDARTTFTALGCTFRPTTRAQASDPLRPPPAAVALDPASKRRRYAGIVRSVFDDVADELRAAHYDLALVDPLEPGAGFAAEASGVPSASYAHFAMDEADGAADVPFSFHFWDRTSPVGEDFVRWWNELRGTLGLAPDPRSPHEHRWFRHSRHLALVLGLPELVHPRGELPAYAHRVGPIIADPPRAAEQPAWVEAVGRSRPAILASVSTKWQDDANLIVALADAVRTLDVDVIATVASTHTLPVLPEHVRLAGFVPHSALVDRVQVIACHAGYGTTTRAACAGVPMLLFPNGRDQFHVARGAVAAGFAIALDRSSEIGAVRAAVEALLSDPGYRARARELAAAATRYSAARRAADLVEAAIA